MKWGFRTPLSTPTPAEVGDGATPRTPRRPWTRFVIASFALCGLAQAAPAWGATVSIGDAPAVVETNGGTTTALFPITVNLDPVPAPITLVYSTTDGTATVSDGDYVAASLATLDIPAGETSALISITLNGDTTYEGNETFGVVLDNSTSGATIDVGTANGTITNDDLEPSISIANASISEATANTLLTFTATLSAVSGRPASVTYSTSNGTASAGSDYTAASNVLTIPAGQTTGTFTVTIQSDALTEATETFDVTLTNPLDVIIGDGAAVGSIIDLSVANLSPSPVSVGEAGGSQIFTVTLTHASSHTVTVDYATANGTANLAGDYGATTGTLTFAPGDTLETFSVPILEDALDEDDETLTVNLSSPVNAAVGAGSSTVTILDNDALPTLSVANAAITEGNAGTSNAVVTVTLSPVSGRAVSVGYQTLITGTATTPQDYSPVNSTLTFPAGTTTQTFNVPVVGDLLNEPAAETVDVQITGATNATIAGGTATVTITDNDPQPTLSVDPATVIVAETNAPGTTATFTVRLSAPSAQQITVNAATADDTAIAGQDYTTTAAALVFAPSETTKNVVVPILADATHEPTESFRLNLSAAGNATIPPPGQGTGTINDNDPIPTVSVVNVSATEASPVVFTVQLSNPTFEAVTVDFSTTNGTAGEFDFTAANGTVTIAAGQTSGTASISTSTDALDENDETFTVTFNNANGATIPGASIGRTGTILDDDQLPTLSVVSTSVIEGDAGPATTLVTFQLSPVSGRDVTFNVATGTGTAGPGDYTAITSTSRTIAAGAASVTIPFSAIGDLVDEENETVPVAMSSIVNAAPGTNPGTMTITDDDTTTVSTNSPSINEGTGGVTTLQFTVSLSTSNDRPVTVNYATADGTATALAPNADYTATSGQLDFTAGQTSRTIDIAITPDNIDELNESFLVNLTNAAAGAQSLTATGGTGTITDNDTSSVSINDVTVTSEGNAGTATTSFNVTLSVPSDRPVAVQYAFTDLTARRTGTALDPADYIVGDGTATFAPGDTSEPVSVDVVGDIRDEVNETASVALTSPTNGAALGDAAGVLTINDDDVPPSLSVNDQTVTEGQPANFSVILNAPSGQTVTVNYAAGGGGVTNGPPPADYDLPPGSLSFAPGETIKTIPVPTHDDGLNELNEAFGISLSGPVNATILDGTGIGTINDNDPVTIAIADATVPELNAGSSLTNVIEVTLSTPSSQTITVNYTIAPGTAQTPADYTATGSSLVFAPSETSRLVPITVVGDLIDEANETVLVTLTGPVANLPPPSQRVGTLTITDDDDMPTLSIDDQTVTEGASATFTATLSAPSGQTVTVDYSAGGGSAANGGDNADYNRAPGTLTFSPGVTTQPIPVQIVEDNVDEPAPAETFDVTLAGAVNATVSDAIGVGTINDNDATPVVAIVGVSANEGTSPATVFANPVATLDRPSSAPITVGYTIAPTGITAGADFTGPLTGTLSFAAGDTSEPIPVDVVADNVFEPNEAFSITLASTDPNVVVGTPAPVTFTLTNDDLQPTISVANVTVGEATPTTQFTVSLSNPSFQTIGATYAVAPGSAATPADFTAAAPVPLVFAPGETSKPITLNIVDDLLDENDETITILLSLPTNATFPGGTPTTGATATITDNDLANQPTVGFQNQTSTETQVEGNQGPAIKSFVIQLSNVSGRNVSVTWQTRDDVAEFAPNAQPNVDYSAVGPTTVVFLPGETTKTVNVSVIGDTNGAEGSESIGLQLSAPVNTSLTGISLKQLLIREDDVANQSPFATPDSLTVARNATGSINVRANDFDPNNDAMFIPDNTNPAHGIASCRFTGVCIYTPTPGYSGPDAFSYTLSDGEATVSGTVTVTVVNAVPVATADTLITAQGVPGSVNVLANDTDPDSAGPLTIASAGPAASGTVACGAGVCNYVPAAGYVGADQFTYTISDPDGATAVGTVTVTVAKGIPLTIAAKANKARSKRGAKNSYTLTIRNPNAGAVTVSSVSVCLPKGFSYVARSVTGRFARVPANGTCGAGKTRLTWAKGVAIAGKGAATLTFKVTVGGAPGTARITATGRAADGFAMRPLTPSASIRVTK